jgi:hypothetical protein
VIYVSLGCARAARCRTGGALWRDHHAPEPAGTPQPQAISKIFHVPADRWRARRFGLAKCNIKARRKLATHDEAITGMLQTIRELMNPPAPKRRGIGFTAAFDEKQTARPHFGAPSISLNTAQLLVSPP